MTAAVGWFVRRQGRPRAAPPPDDFRDWLAEAPENVEAYAAVERLWDAAAEVADDPRLAARRFELTRTDERRRVTRRALAASLAAGVVGLAAGGAYILSLPKPLATQSFRTTVGQQATVTLPDGSVVTLNTDTTVRTRADGERRLVYLDRGQAFFKVAKDRRRPFVVTAAGRTVTALGTAFDVRVDHGELKVVLVEGRVRVESAARAAAAPAASARPPLQATEMTAGSRLVADADTDWRLTRTDAARETSWLRGQIVFDDRPLGEVVEELNRYSNRKIVVDGEALAKTRVSGIFRPGDLHGFAGALKTYGLADVELESEREVRIVALK